MLKSGKMVAIIGVAICCLLVTVATFAFTLPSAKPAIQAAPAAQATPATQATPTAPAAPVTDTTKPNNPPSKPDTKTGISQADTDQYLAAFNKAFATKLGVSEDVLNSAFTGAVNDTLDQMVKDGKITSDEAAKFKAVAGKGPAGALGVLVGNRSADAGNNGPLGNPKELLVNSFPDVAKLFNLTTDELQAKLQSGQSLADLAAAAKVDVQKVKDTILTSFKTQFDAMVKAGKINQTDADNMLKKVTPAIDDFISSKPGTKVNGGIYDKLLGDTTWQVLAQTLNMPVNTIKDQTKAGKSILEIAQAQKVDEAKLRDALQATMSAQLNDLVSKNEVPQDVAPQVLKDIPNLITKFINGKETKS